MKADALPARVIVAMMGLIFAGATVDLSAQNGPDRPLKVRYDKDADGKLSRDELQAAFEALRFSSSGNRGNRGWGPAATGLALTPADVKAVPASVPLYDPGTLRTLFLQFDDADWEQKLEAFYGTDIDLPATATVDGKVYKDVGAHFRGNSSYSSIPTGYKRSLAISFDDVNEDQKLLGYGSLKLLNANSDPTFMRGPLALEIARSYYFSSKANFLRVVINGENWGIYVNVEQFNGDMAKGWFGKGNDARWKAPGSNNGRAGLAYLGDNPAVYRSVYEIKSKDDPAQWEALVNMIRILNLTPPEKLEAALAGVLDVDGALRFLAVDNILASGDGYWTKGGDYAIYRDPKGVFHVLQHDINEFFAGSGGRGGSGTYLHPLQNEGDVSRALAGRLLAVPALKARYLQFVREISEKWMDWKTLGPRVQQYSDLIRQEVSIDTKKLFLNGDFEYGIGSGSGTPMPIRSFVAERRAYLDSLFPAASPAAKP